jgi:hypothetical protein
MARRTDHIPGLADDKPRKRVEKLIEKGVSLLGEPDIAPSRYRCPEHGIVLAQEVQWDRNDAALLTLE